MHTRRLAIILLLTAQLGVWGCVDDKVSPESEESSSNLTLPTPPPPPASPPSTPLVPIVSAPEESAPATDTAVSETAVSSTTAAPDTDAEPFTTATSGVEEAAQPQELPAQTTQDATAEVVAASPEEVLAIPLVIELFAEPLFQGTRVVAVRKLVNSAAGGSILSPGIDQQASSARIHKGPNYKEGACAAAFYADPAGKTLLWILEPGVYPQFKAPNDNKVRSIGLLNPTTNQPCAFDLTQINQVDDAYRYPKPIPYVIRLHGATQTDLLADENDLSSLGLDNAIQWFAVWKGPHAKYYPQHQVVVYPDEDFAGTPLATITPGPKKILTLLSPLNTASSVQFAH